MLQEKTNNQRAVSVCTIEADRNNFREFVGVDEINPRNYPVLYCQPKVHEVLSETENALNILNHHGYKPKVFCSAKENDSHSAFTVLSNKWNWFVVPVTLEKASKIPVKFLEGIGILAKSQINIKGIALATPVPNEASEDVVWKEFSHEAKLAFTIASIPFLMIKTLASTTSASATSSNPGNPVQLKTKPDPVLLVLIESNWIEIGRW